LETEVVDFDPSELACQLTMMEMEIFKSIEIDDFAEKNVNTNPKVQRLFEFFNGITGWVCTELLSNTNLYSRTRLIERFVEISMILRDFNNFNGVAAITSALNSIPVRRLNSTFTRLSQKTKDSLTELLKLIDPSGNHQQLKKSAKRSKITYFTIYWFLAH